MADEIHWIKVVTRPTLPLTVHMMVDGSKEIFKTLGEEFPFYFKMEFANPQTNVFFSEDTIKGIVKVIKKELKKNKDFLLEIAEKGYKDSDILISTAKQITIVDLTQTNNGQLKRYFQTYVDAFSNFTLGLILPFAIEPFLTQVMKEKIRKLNPNFTEEKTEDFFRRLTVVQRDSDIFLEQVDLLEIAVLKKMGAITDNRLSEHATKFGYFGLTNFITSEPWNAKYFEMLLEQFKTPAETLKKNLESRSKELEDYKSFIKSLDVELVKTAELLQDYMFFRTYRIDAMKKAQFYIRSLLAEIAKRFNLTVDDMTYFICPEIIKLLEAGEIPDFEPRKKCFNVGRIGNKIYWNADKIENINHEYSGIIKGNIASKGFAEGVVKLVANAKDVEKVNKGDILVAKMTTPDMVMAMERAGAIVTDEGGVLCHAAIVSREFGIPCIIGTKNATKVLKDGDFVKVDAINGIVEKIPK